MSEWYWVTTHYACGGVEVENEKVIDCAPIFRKWLMGTLWSSMKYRFDHVERIS